MYLLAVSYPSNKGSYFYLEVPHESGSPWENGYIESFNGKLRDELLDREVFTTLKKAKVLAGWWRKEYNEFRPYSAKGYQPPAPVASLPVLGRGTLTL